ncbi:MAG TPA: hypothetical protein VFE62_08385 [Gemmataceae bacterium]|nr:hypothetical protein [Pirellulales bacterium]HZZ78521.1 hypothetical protein [Gemmataceae bacterium]
MSPKDMLSEQVQVVPPFRRVMLDCHRRAGRLFLQISAHPLADAKEAVLAAAAEPERFELPAGNLRIGEQFCVGFRRTKLNPKPRSSTVEP